jgi:hypothetical protein
MTRLVQIKKDGTRRVALVDGAKLRVLEKYETVYALVQAVLKEKAVLSVLVGKLATGEKLDYDPIYNGTSEWKLLPPMDHPDEASRCLVSGTGLTHFGSAKNRQAMHEVDDEEPTDSMKMFRWGMEKGKPEGGIIGIAPEWFYKGPGTILRAHGQPLDVPAYAEDGGEEAEMVGVYLIGQDGRPWRIGMAPGNEFADHGFEKRNYLNLAGSKIRNCSFGPELTIAPEFQAVHGKAKIERAGKAIWEKDISTGEKEMTHSLANLEHHHFKFESHRRAGDVHIHYFGAHSISFGDNVQLADGDIMEVGYEGFGKPLRNPLHIVKGPATMVAIQGMR